MKKYIFLFAFAAVATSCQKYQAGGNYDAIKMTKGEVHYTDADAPKPTYAAKPDSAKMVKPNLIEPALMTKKQQSSTTQPKTAN